MLENLINQEENEIHLCYTCDAEFSINSITEDGQPQYCPYCGSDLEVEDEEEFDEEE